MTLRSKYADIIYIVYRKNHHCKCVFRKYVKFMFQFEDDLLRIVSLKLKCSDFLLIIVAAVNEMYVFKNTIHGEIDIGVISVKC